MKIELKKFKTVKGHDDTLPYEAEIWADGKLVGYTSNDGWGGDDLHYASDKALYAEAEKFINAMPPEVYEGTELKMTFRYWTASEANRLQRLKEEKKMQKLFANSIVYGIPGEPNYSYLKFSMPLADVMLSEKGLATIKMEIATKKKAGYTIFNTNLEGLI